MSSAWTAWSLELRGDELADLAYDGVVVLRAVQAVVRDRNWDPAGTVVAREGDPVWGGCVTAAHNVLSMEPPFEIGPQPTPAEFPVHPNP